MAPTSPSASFSIIMNSNKFVFLIRAFAAVSSLYSMIKAICERDSICRRRQRDSVETAREEKTSVTVHSANAEIQLSDALRRFDGANNIARYVGFLIAWAGRETSCRS